MCELDRTYIGGIERGERNVALVNIEKIAKTLRLSIAQLFRGFEAPACTGSWLLPGRLGEACYDRTALNPGGSLALAESHAACSISFNCFSGRRFRTCSRSALVSCQGPTMSIVNSQ